MENLFLVEALLSFSYSIKGATITSAEDDCARFSSKCLEKRGLQACNIKEVRSQDGRISLPKYIRGERPAEKRYL